MLFSKLVRLGSAVLATAGQAMARLRDEETGRFKATLAVTPDICKKGLCGTTLPVVITGPSGTFTLMDPIFSKQSGYNSSTTVTVPVTSTTTVSRSRPILPREYSLTTSSELQGYGSHPAPTLSPETSIESTATATETSWVSAATSMDVDISSTSLPALSLTSTSSTANVTTAETTPVVTSATLLKSTVPGLTVPSSGSQTTSSMDGASSETGSATSSETSSETSTPASPSSTPHTGSGHPTHGSPDSLVMAVMCASLLSIALAFVVVG